MVAPVDQTITFGEPRGEENVRAGEQLVVCGRQQRTVPAQVGPYGLFRRSVRGVGDVRERRTQLGDVCVGTAPGRKRGRGGFQDIAELGQVLEEDVTRPGRDLPPDHVRVEQVPVGAWAHEGALLLP